MKARLPVFTAAGVLTLGLLAALSGCANTPTREATLDSTFTPGFAAAAADFEAPVPLRTVAPLYPFDLKRAGISGVVNVTCLVDERGRVSDPQAKASTHADFTQPALDAIMRWQFKPAMRGGVPVAMRISIPITFRLVD